MELFSARTIVPGCVALSHELATCIIPPDGYRAIGRCTVEQHSLSRKFMTIAPVADVLRSVLSPPAGKFRSPPIASLEKALAAAEIGDEVALENAASSIDQVWPAGANRIRKRANELRTSIAAKLEARRRAAAARDSAAKRADGIGEPIAPSRRKHE